MGKTTDNPHDKRFKELFSDKRAFISLLKDCVKEPWVDEIDEDTLSQTNNSFILQDFSEKEADVVYEASIGGNKVIFYILLELQSAVDYRMPYRLLLYIVEILRYYYNHSDVNEREKKDFKFTVVFPLVFFTGKGTWTVPLSLKDMFNEPERFGNFVLDFDYMLLDAKGIDDNSIKGFYSTLLGVVLMLEKSQSAGEFRESFKAHINEIKGLNDEELRILNLFVRIVDAISGNNKLGDIRKLLRENPIEEVDAMLSDVIENARFEEERLLAKGKSEGRLEGKLEGKLEVAKSMLQENFPVSVIMKLTGLSSQQIEDIKWGGRYVV